MPRDARRSPRPYGARLHRVDPGPPFNLGTAFGAVSVFIAVSMIYPTLFILISDWLSYPTIYNYAAALPLTILFWVLAKRSGAPKGLLMLPIVLVLLGGVIVISNSLAPNEAVKELKLHPIPSDVGD